MWDDGPVIVTIDERGVATATLNRPEVSNALSPEMMGRLVSLFDLCASGRVRIVCLAANGRNFCAGGDVKAASDPDAPKGPGVPEFMKALTALPVPLITFAQGACVGVGAAIAACSDLVIATPDVHFSLPEVRLGFAPRLMFPYVALAIGVRRAGRLALTGERLPAASAKEAGLVDIVAEREAQWEAAAPLIDALMRAGPGATAATKSMIAHMRNFEPEPHDPAEFDTEEAREGRAAFIGKRPPNWYKPPPAESQAASTSGGDLGRQSTAGESR